jgi:hypothetical protein
MQKAHDLGLGPSPGKGALVHALVAANDNDPTEPPPAAGMRCTLEMFDSEASLGPHADRLCHAGRFST